MIFVGLLFGAVAIYVVVKSVVSIERSASAPATRKEMKWPAGSVPAEILLDPTLPPDSMLGDILRDPTLGPALHEAIVGEALEAWSERIVRGDQTTADERAGLRRLLADAAMIDYPFVVPDELYELAVD